MTEMIKHESCSDPKSISFDCKAMVLIYILGRIYILGSQFWITDTDEMMDAHSNDMGPSFQTSKHLT